jgi:hypothetical protein
MSPTRQPLAILFDVDSKIPNLALMKWSAWLKHQGWQTKLEKKFTDLTYQKADRYLASAVFYAAKTHRRLELLQQLYGTNLEIGGSGFDLKKRLPDEVETCFPDYGLYGHSLYATGFLTRGCSKRCAFCIVPQKEGKLKRLSSSFDDFVPMEQKNVMLLDDNLLSFSGVEDLLREIIDRRLAINFSQTLDIAWLTEDKNNLLLQIDSRNSKFTKRRMYFSLNYPNQIRLFEERAGLLKAFGPACISVVAIYGFDTSLSQDYERWMYLRRKKYIPFFQEYWPILGVQSRLPEMFFDMDLDRIIRLTFYSNGINWEKYLRWLNRKYFEQFGRYYRPLIEIIYRYNNKQSVWKYLKRPDLLTDHQYHKYPEKS